MDDKLITEEQVDVMFNEHLKRLGSNPGSSWVGKLIWKLKQKQEFVTALKNKGHTIL